MAKPSPPYVWVPGAALASGCVRYWPVESSATGTLTDYSPSAKPLTIVGTPTLDNTGPQGGNLLVLTGSQYATGDDAGLPTGANPWTVAAYIKTTQTLSSPGEQTYLNWGPSNTGGSRVNLCQSNWSSAGGQYKAQSITQSSYGTVQTGNAAVNDGTWKRATVVYDGTRVSFYINGVLDRSDVNGNVTLAVALTNTVFFGKWAGGNPWIGGLGDVAIWNRALSPSEIAADAADPYTQIATVVTLTPGVASLAGTQGTASVGLTSTDAAGGTAPYAYQWQRSPYGLGTWANVAGATGLTLTDTGLTPGGEYDYRLRFTDAAAGVVYSNTVSVKTLYPADHANIHYTPGWKIIGSGATSVAVTTRGGQQATGGFSGTSAKAVLDVTNLATPANVNLFWYVDYLTRNTGNPQAVLTLGTGLASGSHTFGFGNAGQSSAADCWTPQGTGFPANCLAIKGWLLDFGATLLSGPSAPSTSDLGIGDSITAGAASGPSGSGDAGYSWFAAYCQAMGVEPDFDAFSSSGFAVTAGGSLVPPLASRISAYWSGAARVITGRSRVLVCLGQNDSGSYASTVAADLALLRTAIGANVPLYVLITPHGSTRTQVTAGFNSYAGTLTTFNLGGGATAARGANDTKTVLLDHGSALSAAFNAGTAGLYSADGVHINTLGAIRFGGIVAWMVESYEALSATPASIGGPPSVLIAGTFISYDGG